MAPSGSQRRMKAARVSVLRNQQLTGFFRRSRSGPFGSSLTSTAPGKANPCSDLHKHPGGTPAKVPLEYPLFHGTIDAIEGSISSAAASCRFSFFEATYFALAIHAQPKTYPLESIICKMLIS